MTDEQFDELIREARGCDPFDLERAGYGLETRVAARMRAESTVDDLLVKWVWRGAFGVAPVVALLVGWLCVWSGFSAETLYSFSAAGDLASYLPLSFR